MKEVRATLMARLEELREAIRLESDELSSSMAGSDDAADAASGLQDLELSSQLAEANSQDLQEVLIAIERCDAGTYGICESCEKPIAKARMEALPATSLCVKCKEALERG